MSLDYISTYYGVPAKRGQRVEYTSATKPARQGVIVGAHNQYLKIRFDGDTKTYAGVFHPTDGITYL